MTATNDHIEKLRKKTLKLMRQRGVQTLQVAEERNVYPDHLCTGDTTPYFTGYDNGRLFGWDQYFEGILQLHFGWEPTYIRNSLRLFLQTMEHNGYIPRTLPRIWWGEFHAQPFLAQQAALLLHHGHHPIPEHLAHLFYNMKRYLLFWLDNLDIRGEGLSVWDHAGHTGMDNHYERAGYFHDNFCEGVDLNSYLVRECLAFAQLAEFLGKDYAAEAAPFRHRAAQRRDAINRWCWNEQEGIRAPAGTSPSRRGRCATEE